MEVADILLLIKCDNCVLKCLHTKPFTDNIGEKKRPDIIFNIHFDQPMPTPKYEEKIVWHKRPETKLNTSWYLSHTENRLLLRFISPYPFYYSVLIDCENGICDFYFEQKEYFMENGLDISVFDLEYMLALYMLPKFNGILLHANVVDYKGKALVFLGTSGTGKSTLAELYRSQRAACVLGNERVIIRKKKGRFLVYDVAWQKKNVELEHKPVELYKLFFPQTNSKNLINRKTRVEACALILDQSFHTFWNKPIMEQTLNFIDELTHEIPCYDLWFVPDETGLKYLDSFEKERI